MASTSQPLAWHRRLEARVVAVVTVLIALALGAVLIQTTRIVTGRSLERTSSDLEAARSAFSQLVNDRADFASAQTALVTALPVFRAFMSGRDSRLLAADLATFDTMTGEYRKQLKADFIVVTGSDSRWLTSAGWPEGARPSEAMTGAIAGAAAGHSGRNIVALQDRLYLVVSEPARFADEVLGTLSVAYALDDAFTRRLADVAHSDVNLVANGRLYASSLAGTDRAALTAAIDKGAWPANGVSGTVQRIGDGEYAVGAFPLPSAPTGRLMLLQNWGPNQRFVNQIQARLLIAGAIIFAVALAGGIVFSRRMSRPLHDLAAAAEDIAGGNWTRQLPVRGSVEAAMMAKAVNDMTTSLRHWYEEAGKRHDELRQAQKLEAIGRLAGGVAHDFNNLLTAIKGYGDLLMEDLEPDDRRREDVDEILKAADRAASLTKQLLAFGRRQVVAVRVISLDRVVAGTEKMLQRLIGEDIEFTTSLGQTAGFVRADQSQIEQVLLNLVVNARDAMPKGGKLSIELGQVEFSDAGGRRHGTLQPGPYTRLSVSDTGCGMSDDVRSRIFEPFFTTKEEGRGTGLGLAMVYGVVEQLGGGIDIDTAIDRGTTFHVYLPQTSEPEAPVESGSAGVAGSGHGVETVLLVEDQLHGPALTGSSLKKAGSTVLEATHGEQALQIVHAHQAPIDLLLTDVVMPGMNGRELAEHVKLLRRETRVLYMSGYSDDAILRRGVQTSSTAFIQKPFSMEALMGRIRETLKAPLETLL